MPLVQVIDDPFMAWTLWCVCRTRATDPLCVTKPVLTIPLAREVGVWGARTHCISSALNWISTPCKERLAGLQSSQTPRPK